MTIVSQFFMYSFVGFAVGYLLGRIGHYYVNGWMGNPSWTPHHWIYGVILIPVSSYLVPSLWGLIILFFGVGHFISDFSDFLNLEFFSKDKEGKKFFSI